MADDNSLLSSDELQKALEDFNISGDSEEKVEKSNQEPKKEENISVSNITETVNNEEKVIEKTTAQVKQELPLQPLSEAKKEPFKKRITNVNIRTLILSVFIFLLVIFSFLAVFTDLFSVSKKMTLKKNKVYVESKEKLDDAKKDNTFANPPAESDLLNLSEEKLVFIEKGVSIFIKNGVKEWEGNVEKAEELHNKFKSSLSLDDFLVAFSFDLSSFLLFDTSMQESYFSSKNLEERIYPAFYFWRINDITREKIIYSWSKRVREKLSFHLKK